jgi:hypothetical protein
VAFNCRDSERDGERDFERYGRPSYERSRYDDDDRCYFRGYDDAERKEEERQEERRQEERAEERRMARRAEERRIEADEEAHYERLRMEDHDGF